ncbi:putative cationic amino acid transporter [Blattella germanica]|nr:putative cationic amino acid transporter [Blattella germanica]
MSIAKVQKNTSACYAEFGVRVPHTTGSAYMYSYVTVGEFIAFVIGWNMVLEYLIGTSACACALSACFDALANGAISTAIAGAVGTMFGRPPDFLAFVITILMTVLMAAGVKKSLVFNNVLNALNLAVWVFVMTAGLFYVDSHNWSEHKGFLPFGWSGVLTGAATCFYAFIGFDIIATTGEEANNPKRSIPLAIVTSLVDADSALVEMFGQVGAWKCKCIVAVGALAGLSVSMFGSMFPMPRIVYAMAQDGLIFRTLSQVWPATGTPVLATFISGMAAAVAALVIQLEVLVEMISPDSDDTYPGEEPEEDFSMRDDQFLVSDRSENKFYGTLHGGSTGGGGGGVAGAVGPGLGYIGRRLQAATYLCPAIFPWVDTGPATEESGLFVMKMVGLLYLLILIFDLIIVCGMGSMTGATTFFLVLFLILIIAVLLVISRKPQNRKTLLFMTPGLPFVPAIAVMVNIYLIFKLSILTLIELERGRSSMNARRLSTI